MEYISQFVLVLTHNQSRSETIFSSLTGSPLRFIERVRVFFFFFDLLLHSYCHFFNCVIN